jgi:hypothetical protein
VRLLPPHTSEEKKALESIKLREQALASIKLQEQALASIQASRTTSLGINPSFENNKPWHQSSFENKP